ncbi:hypothetical protein SARC_01354 [Sphaeroforma arctica JP610]|uniref:Uncharacterized protein n=1 Tax=Sphaeroforma arctica JP610 TaxID=667725 RepID=A0A0L0GC95_9EUKA|nr:hypothetical protein SARC_01354 [Sphaeroforma arctica JP610]KNC86526.1 hypothetical protein SARC_01354 [Sphaeroforma arctica JP610]|eukprot:XP_014160428.1 hypothetical protein SARC_01354 [Sphaeroforma arctica JP610]
MAVPMIYLSLIHAIFRHGPNHWPSTMTLFFNALIDEDNLTSSLPRFGITEPRQLLYLCHLIGPTVGSMSSVPLSVKWASHTNDYQEHYSLGLLFMQLMRAFVQVNNAVVARHGTYVLPCTATSRVINFLYYIKYHYAFESFVWDDAQQMIQLFDPPLRLQLRFLRRSSP